MWFLLAACIATGEAQTRVPAEAVVEPAPHPELHLHNPDLAWLQAYDPTLLAPRLLTQWEHQDLAHGDSNGKVYLNLREAFLIREGLAFGVQAEIPYNWAEKSGADFSGLGDLEMRAGFAGRLAPGWRWGLGTNARFDTAAESELGDGMFELRPIAAVRWDLTKSVNVGLNTEYTFVPEDQGPGVHETDTMELKFPVTIKLGHGWSALISYQPKWNLEKGDSRVDRLDLSTTVLLGEHKKYALTSGVELPLWEDSLDYKAFVGLQWFFR